MRLSSSEFADPRHEKGLERFGEIAGLFSCGGDIIIEFYDTRAALRCSMAIPGSQPQKCGRMCHYTGHGSAKDTDKTSGGSIACRVPPVASPSPPMRTVRSPPGLTRSDAANNDAFLLHADRRGCYPEFDVPEKESQTKKNRTTHFHGGVAHRAAKDGGG